jgi:hypothetical protein
MPAIVDQARTTYIPRPSPELGDPRRPPATARRDDPARTLGPSLEPSARTAVAASAVSIVSGWATSVVATDLIAGWWRSDKLFCLAVGFLAVVFAIATVSGVILLLQRRPVGRRLIVAGAVVALLTQLGVFLTDARVAWIVYLLPLLPIAAAALALHPETKRYLLQD